MRIGFGNDHAAIEMKKLLMEHLSAAGHECIDYGTNDGTVKTDYPVKGRAVAEAVASGEVERGVVLCGTGLGISLAANKVKGIRCCPCSDTYSARMAVQHNNANMLAIGARTIGPEVAVSIADAFFGAEFEGGRHARRVDQVIAIEEEYFK